MSSRIIGIIFLVFFVCGTAQAQIVLNPPASVGSNSSAGYGTGSYFRYQLCSGWTSTMPTGGNDVDFYGGYSDNLKLSFMGFYVRNTFFDSGHCTYYPFSSNYWEFYQWTASWSYSNLFPVIEFDISSLSGAGVTEENFESAHIDGLKVTATSGEITKANINDLWHWYQNGHNDGWFSPGERPFTYIMDLFNTAPSVGTIFNDIDVTAAVYEDLFGAVPAQNYSGFVIDCDSNSGKGTIVFDNDLPSLRIIIDEPEVPTLSILGILVLCCFFSLFALLRTLKNEKS